MNPNQPQQIHIDPSQTTPVTCKACNSELFLPMYMLRKLSILVSPTGREEIIQVPVMVCGQCGKPQVQDEPPQEGSPIGEKQGGDGSKIIS